MARQEAPSIGPEVTHRTFGVTIQRKVNPYVLSVSVFHTAFDGTEIEDGLWITQGPPDEGQLSEIETCFSSVLESYCYDVLGTQQRLFS